MLFERLYVERTSFQVISLPLEAVDGVADRNLGVEGVAGVATSRAHSYRSYLPTKIHPPPSPRRISTCHFPRTPRGSRSNLHRTAALSESVTRVLRIACETRLRMGRILRRGAGVRVGDLARVGDLGDLRGDLGSRIRGRRRCIWRFWPERLPGLVDCGGRTRRYSCSSSENDIGRQPGRTDQ
jgi:hypothetical protein